MVVTWWIVTFFCIVRHSVGNMQCNRVFRYTCNQWCHMVLHTGIYHTNGKAQYEGVYDGLKASVAHVMEKKGLKSTAVLY